MDKEEVTLRRTIGLKKDEYYLDKKHVTKHDVINLLESAGFSRSNPYYIVQQGKVNAIALMKDSERLELLKEVAGTRVYDERRAESEKIMMESRGRREKINELLRYIDERLHELEAEKEELREYQSLDKERRAIEYNLHNLDLQAALDELQKLEERRQGELERSNEAHREAERLREEWKQAERELKALSAELLAVQRDRAAADQERTEALQRRAKLQLDAEHASQTLQSKQSSRQSNEREARRIEEQLSRVRSELEEAQRAFEAAARAEVEKREQVQATERRIADLHAKQGRSAQFASREERDRWLRGEIRQVERSLQAKREQVEALQKQLAEGRAQLERAAQEARDKSAQSDAQRATLERLLGEINAVRARLDEMANQRREFQRVDAENAEQLRQRQEELAKAERLLQGSVNRVVSAGIAAVRRLARERGISGVYGPLIELFDVDAKFQTAVEVTAGPALFYVVVDTDDTATRLLNAMNEERVNGRVTFMPLNRLEPRRALDIQSQDAIPLVRNLRYQPHLDKAFQQVFGKTLICRNLEVATSLSRMYNLNCVTPDGDQVNKSGGITGGYHDTRASRLQAQRQIRHWQAQLAESQARADASRRTLQRLDQDITQALSELSRLEAQRDQIRSALDQLALEARNARRQEELCREALDTRQRQLDELGLSLRQLEATLEGMRRELDSELLDRLSAAEQRELRELTAALTQQQRDLIALSARRADADTRRTSLENQAQAQSKHLEELQRQREALDVEAERSAQQRLRQELEAAEAAVADTSERLAGLDRRIDEMQGRLQRLRQEVESLRAKEQEAMNSVRDEAKRMESLMARRHLALQQRDEALRKIKELGPAPVDVERYRGQSRQELTRAAARTFERLKKYSHVNRKAMDQYVSFTEQREQLAARKEELDKGEESIRELIEVLDQRKDEAIERTFKGVAKHFAEVFHELVPTGRASLVMLKKPTGVEGEGEAAAEGEEATSGRIRAYHGVGIRVSFTSTAAAPDESFKSIQQLSGGQKSLVALAFIFAIQRCDRAPFYLFDEVDSALDPQHRMAVAKLIEQESRNAQFIVITFKPELVQRAERVYRISYANRVSRIEMVQPAEALAVLEASERDEARERDAE